MSRFYICESLGGITLAYILDIVCLKARGLADGVMNQARPIRNARHTPPRRI